MKAVFLAIAVLAPFGSALPQAPGLPLFNNPSKSKDHAASNSIEMAEMGVNHAGTSGGNHDGTPGDNPGGSSNTAPGAKPSTFSGGLSSGRIGKTIGGLFGAKKDDPNRVLPPGRIINGKGQEVADIGRLFDHRIREIMTNTRQAALYARDQTKTRPDMLFEYFKSTSPSTTQQVSTLLNNIVERLDSMTFTYMDDKHWCNDNDQDKIPIPGYILDNERKVVLCRSMHSPLKNANPYHFPAPSLGKEVYPYIPGTSTRCGGKSAITVLMLLLNSGKGNPKPDFITYQDIRKMNSRQEMQTPETLALYAQALNWEKDHGYGSCSGVAKHYYPEQKIDPPKLKVTTPEGKEVPGPKDLPTPPIETPASPIAQPAHPIAQQPKPIALPARPVQAHVPARENIKKSTNREQVPWAAFDLMNGQNSGFPDSQKSTRGV